MLITKTNPIGLDNAIQKLQTHLHTQLMSKWGLDVNDATQNALYQCYGRCYRNKRDSGYVAEIFVGGKDYKDAYWNDNLNAISFFGDSGKVEYDKGMGKANVHLVFFVNLAKIKPTISHRADEEVRLDVVSAIGTNSFGFHLLGYETGIENVLREYPVSRDALKDMQPVHMFRINLQALYKNNNC
jgi:hypothetical protein